MRPTAWGQGGRKGGLECALEPAGLQTLERPGADQLQSTPVNSHQTEGGDGSTILSFLNMYI